MTPNYAQLWTVEYSESVNAWIARCGKNGEEPADQAWFYGPHAEKNARRFINIMNNSWNG